MRIGFGLGHGRLVDTADGKWYMTVHAYESGYRTLGRQLLLLPIEWTADGWFRVQPELAANSEFRGFRYWPDAISL